MSRLPPREASPWGRVSPAGFSKGHTVPQLSANGAAIRVQRLLTTEGIFWLVLSDHFPPVPTVQKGDDYMYLGGILNHVLFL